MAKATVNLNKMASALVGEATKVRIRVVGDEVQILPTNRVKGNNLPKGEQLIDLKVRADRGTKRFTLPEGMHLELGSKFRTKPRKHGWLALVEYDDRFDTPSLPGVPDESGASITAK